MQVNHGPFEISANIAAGVKLLREYYLMLGSAKAAVIAYNVGPGNYLKGKYKSTYWNKYKEHVNGYASWYESYASDDEQTNVELNTALSDAAVIGLDLPVLPGYSDSSLLVEDRQTRLD